MHRATVVLGMTLTGIGACGGGEIDLPVVSLGPARDSVPVPFDLVTHAVPLEDSRWVVLAANQELLAVVDLARGSVDTLGGRRHLAYRNPLTLFTTGEGFYLSDWGLRRVTAWDRAATLVDSFPALDRVRGALPEGRDRAGRFYVELPAPGGRDGRGNLDSSAVVRLDPTSEATDTVTRLAPLDMVEIETDRGRRYERRVMSGEDVWGVRRDGAVWVARVAENRVTWYPPGSDPRMGPLLPDRILPVTEADREQFLNQFPPALQSVARKLPFAAIKPPFVAGFTADDGTVWLERSRAPSDPDRQYQVIDSTGALARRVHLPGWGRILAVAGGTALAFESRSSGGILLRYPVATEPGPDDQPREGSDESSSTILPN